MTQANRLTGSMTELAITPVVSRGSISPVVSSLRSVGTFDSVSKEYNNVKLNKILIPVRDKRSFL